MHDSHRSGGLTASSVSKANSKMYLFRRFEGKEDRERMKDRDDPRGQNYNDLRKERGYDIF